MPEEDNVKIEDTANTSPAVPRRDPSWEERRTTADAPFAKITDGVTFPITYQKVLQEILFQWVAKIDPNLDQVNARFAKAYSDYFGLMAPQLVKASPLYALTRQEYSKKSTSKVRTGAAELNHQKLTEDLVKWWNANYWEKDLVKRFEEQKLSKWSVARIEETIS